MGRKFIPNGDMDFIQMAEGFARNLAKEPERFAVAREESEALLAIVAKYRAALTAVRTGGTRSPMATREKERARGEAERHIRRIANAIRANQSVDDISKMLLRIRERTERPKQLTVPQEPPRLKFVQALHKGSGATPMHELSYRAFDSRLAKPDGAVRLELFVDLIPPDERIPAYPGANHGSRPWYLRSYTRSPIVLTPPMPRVPMRVVYWGRWADSVGNVGPFSATAVGWIEGGVHHLLPGGVGISPTGSLGSRKPVPILEDLRDPGPPQRERTYVVAVLEAQYRSTHPQEVETPALPGAEEQREQRQLEAPRSAESEAA